MKNLRSTNSTTTISSKPQLKITFPNEDPEKTELVTVKMVEAKCEVGYCTCGKVSMFIFSFFFK